MGLCFFQSAFWQSGLQYHTVEHLEHFLDAGFSHLWHVLLFRVVADMGDSMVNSCDEIVERICKQRRTRFTYMLNRIVIT